MRGRFHRSGHAGVSFFAFQDIITCVTGILVIITVFLSLSVKEGSAIFQPVQPSPSPELKARLEELLTAIASRRQNAEAAADMSTAAPQSLAIEVAMLEQEAKELREFIEANTTKDKPASELEAAISRNIALAGSDSRRLMDGIRQFQTKSDEMSALLEAKKREVSERQAAMETLQQQNRLALIRDRSRTGKEPVIVVVDGGGLTLHRFDNGPPESLDGVAGFRARLSGFAAATHYFVFYNKPSGTPVIASCLDAARSAGFDVGYDAVPEDLILELEPAKTPAP